MNLYSPALAHWTYLSTCKIWNRKEYGFLRLDYEFLWENYIKNYVASGFQFNIGQKKIITFKLKIYIQLKTQYIGLGLGQLKKWDVLKKLTTYTMCFIWKKHISLFVFDL